MEGRKKSYTSLRPDRLYTKKSKLPPILQNLVDKVEIEKPKALPKVTIPSWLRKPLPSLVPRNVKKVKPPSVTSATKPVLPPILKHRRPLYEAPVKVVEDISTQQVASEFDLKKFLKDVTLNRIRLEGETEPPPVSFEKFKSKPQRSLPRNLRRRVVRLVPKSKTSFTFIFGKTPSTIALENEAIRLEEEARAEAEREREEQENREREIAEALRNKQMAGAKSISEEVLRMSERSSSSLNVALFEKKASSLSLEPDQTKTFLKNEPPFPRSISEEFDANDNCLLDESGLFKRTVLSLSSIDGDFLSEEVLIKEETQEDTEKRRLCSYSMNKPPSNVSLPEIDTSFVDWFVNPPSDDFRAVRGAPLLNYIGIPTSLQMWPKKSESDSVESLLETSIHSTTLGNKVEHDNSDLPKSIYRPSNTSSPDVKHTIQQLDVINEIDNAKDSNESIHIPDAQLDTIGRKRVSLVTDKLDFNYGASPPGSPTSTPASGYSQEKLDRLVSSRLPFELLTSESVSNLSLWSNAGISQENIQIAQGNEPRRSSLRLDGKQNTELGELAQKKRASVLEIVEPSSTLHHSRSILKSGIQSTTSLNAVSGLKSGTSIKSVTINEDHVRSRSILKARGSTVTDFIYRNSVFQSDTSMNRGFNRKSSNTRKSDILLKSNIDRKLNSSMQSGISYVSCKTVKYLMPYSTDIDKLTTLGSLPPANTPTIADHPSLINLVPPKDVIYERPTGPIGLVKMTKKQLLQYQSELLESLPASVNSICNEIPLYEIICLTLEFDGYPDGARFIRDLIEYDIERRATKELSGPALHEHEPTLHRLDRVLRESAAFGDAGQYGFACDMFTKEAFQMTQMDNWWWLAKQHFGISIKFGEKMREKFARPEATARYTYGKFLMVEMHDLDGAEYHLLQALILSEGKSWNASKLLPISKEDTIYHETAHLLSVLNLNRSVHCTECLGEDYDRFGVEYARDACIFARPSKDTFDIWKATYQLGVSYRKNGDPANAIKYLKKYCSLSKAANNHKCLLLGFKELGIAYLKADDIEQGYLYLIRFRFISKNYGMSENIAEASVLLAELLWSQRQYLDALDYALESQMLYSMVGRVRESETARDLVALIKTEMLLAEYISVVRDAGSFEESSQVLCDWKDNFIPFWDYGDEVGFSQSKDTQRTVGKVSSIDISPRLGPSHISQRHLQPTRRHAPLYPIENPRNRGAPFMIQPYNTIPFYEELKESTAKRLEKKNKS